MLQNAIHRKAFVNIVPQQKRHRHKAVKFRQADCQAQGNKKVGTGRANLDAYDKVINNC